MCEQEGIFCLQRGGGPDCWLCWGARRCWWRPWSGLVVFQRQHFKMYWKCKNRSCRAITTTLLHWPPSNEPAFGLIDGSKRTPLGKVRSGLNYSYTTDESAWPRKRMRKKRRRFELHQTAPPPNGFTSSSSSSSSSSTSKWVHLHS